MSSVAPFAMLLFCCWALASAFVGAETNCPYFQYLSYGDEFIGKVTLPITQAVTELHMKFSQRRPITSNFFGRLTLYEDEKTTKDNIQNGRPVSYRVDFPTPDVMPRLVLLQVNGIDLCTGSNYSPPSTSIELTNTLRSTTILYSIYNAPPEVIFSHVNVRPTRRQYLNTVPQNIDETSFIELSSLQNSTISRPARVTTRTQPQAQPQENEDEVPTTMLRFSLSSIDDFQPTQQPSRQHFQTVPQNISKPSLFELSSQQETTTTFRPTIVRTQPRFQSQAEQDRKAPTLTLRSSFPSSDELQPERSTSKNVKCGIEGNTIPLVHGGIQIARGRYPWMAAIYHKESSNLNFKCGGSLLSERIVITAAHCVDGKREHEILVWLGRHDLNSYNENGTVSRDVQKIRQHHEYNVGVMSDADVAMLTLRSPVFFSVFIQPICVWGADDPIEIRPNERGLIAGWGKDELGNAITRYPKSVEQEIVDEVTCLRSLLVPDVTSNRTLCAGNKDGTGPCTGDSGGGLMLKRNGRWLLRGITSLGLTADDQCDLGEYVVYCDLAKHINWVLQGMT